MREIRKVEQRINMNRNNFFNVQRPVNPPPMQRIANEPERHFNFVMREDNNPPRLGLGSLGFFQI